MYITNVDWATALAIGAVLETADILIMVNASIDA